MSHVLLTMLFAAPLLLLVGCNKGGCGCGSCGKGEGVIKFGKETVVDADEFDKTIKAVVSANPMVQQFYPSFSQKDLATFYQQIAQNLSKEYLMMRWINDEKISSTPEYQKRREEIVKALERDLAVRAFNEKLVELITLGENEPKEFYETAKLVRQEFQQPPFMTQAGGVKADIITVTTSAAAEGIKSKLAAVADIKKLATAEKLKHQDLGFVTARTPNIDEAVKATILGATKFPTTGIVKVADNKFIVFKAHKKQEPVFADYDKLDERVKDYALQVLRKEKFDKLLNEKLEELSKKYNVAINNDLLDQKAAAERPEQKAEEKAATPADAAPAPIAQPAA